MTQDLFTALIAAAIVGFATNAVIAFSLLKDIHDTLVRIANSLDKMQYRMEYPYIQNRGGANAKDRLL